MAIATTFQRANRRWGCSRWRPGSRATGLGRKSLSCEPHWCGRLGPFRSNIGPVGRKISGQEDEDTENYPDTDNEEEEDDPDNDEEEEEEETKPSKSKKKTKPKKEREKMKTKKKEEPSKGKKKTKNETAKNEVGLCETPTLLARSTYFNRNRYTIPR